MFEFLWVPLLTGALAATPTQPAAAPPPDRPFTRLVQNFGSDAKGLAHLETVTILGLGGAAALLTRGSDDEAHAWALEAPSPGWTAAGRVAGDGWVQGGLAVATWGLGEMTGRPLMTHVGSDLIRAQVLNMVTTRALKIAVNRRRPSGGDHAFPSGHTSASFATAGVLHRHLGWRAGAPAYLAAGFVGLTRVRDRAHWVSDTVFGAAMGLAAAWSVTRDHDSRAWSVTAVATPGGGAVVVRW